MTFGFNDLYEPYPVQAFLLFKGPGRVFPKGSQEPLKLAKKNFAHL